MAQTRKIILSTSILHEIEQQGEVAYPNECCGVMIGLDEIQERGVNRHVERLISLENSFEAGEQYHRFSLNPLDLAKAEKEAGRQGKLVLGFYHSHPDHPARPSEYDRVHAWPFYSYVIVAIEKGKAALMTSWQLNDQTEAFEEETIQTGSKQAKDETMSNVQSNGYATPDVLVSTDWVASHLNEANLKIVEVDVDTTSYEKGHIPRAIGWNWQTDLNDRVRRDIVDPRTFAELNRRAGIRNSDTVVLYGDNNNWFAAWALWQFKYYGHKDVRLMNGGRKKWELEKRATTTDRPSFTKSEYAIPTPDESIRAYRRQVEDVLDSGRANLVDVRSPDEFTGKVIAPPGMTETAQRGGHIPGARSIPWAKTANEDGTFKSAPELRSLYSDAGVDLNKPTIAYCRIGERSSHTWFVLKYLLGAKDVRNYDGSWTEWGNLVGAPIEVGAGESLAKPNVRCE